MLTIEIDVAACWPADIGWQDLCQNAVEAAFAQSAFTSAAQITRTIETSIKLSDNEDVHALNKTYRDKDKPTNILSFPMIEPAALGSITTDGSGQILQDEILLGDMVLAYQICEQEAAARKINLTDHVTHLVIHGTLHLLGYDHLDDISAQAMESLEIAALNSLDIDDPYGPDIEGTEPDLHAHR